MNQKHKLAALTAGLILTFAANIPAQTVVPLETVLASNARTKVTYEDLLAEVARIPEENRLEFMLSPQRLATVVENILINKIMSSEAQQSGLQNQPKIAAEIRNQTEKVIRRLRRLRRCFDADVQRDFLQRS